MKKFLMVTPQQQPGKLNLTNYAAQDNSRLEYGQEAHFPLIPLINGYTETGDTIQVITLTSDLPSCKHNLNILKEDLSAMSEEKGFDCQVVSIDVPFDSSSGCVLDDFQKLIAHVDDDDILHACITFGSKPMVLAMMMALRYAYRMKRNASIECLVYGEQDYSSNPPTGKIYDMTEMLKLDDLVRTLADLGVKDPESVIDLVMKM